MVSLRSAGFIWNPVSQKGEGGEVAHCVRSLATKPAELSLIIEAHRGEKKKKKTNLIPAVVL